MDGYGARGIAVVAIISGVSAASCMLAWPTTVYVSEIKLPACIPERTHLPTGSRRSLLACCRDWDVCSKKICLGVAERPSSDAVDTLVVESSAQSDTQDAGVEPGRPADGPAGEQCSGV